jgi:hypothetical protein
MCGSNLRQGQPSGDRCSLSYRPGIAQRRDIFHVPLAVSLKSTDALRFIASVVIYLICSPFEAQQPDPAGFRSPYQAP